MSLPALFSGENRRAALMGVVGAPVIIALLAFRIFGGGGSDLPPLPAGSIPSTVPAPPAGGTAPPTPVPAPLPPVNSALLRDPFCPLAAAPGAAPADCAPRAVPSGLQAIGLQDVFTEGGARLARMRVGSFTFPNLHVGDAVEGSLRVVSLSERCGEFEFAGNPFSLCVGEQTFK